MIITFKQKLTAIKESVENWDNIANGKVGKGCSLCNLYAGNACTGCPIYEKTGKKHCGDTPYNDWDDTPYSDFATKVFFAKKFRDWLKDLYVEVSERGEGKKTLAEEIAGATDHAASSVAWLPPEDTAKELERKWDEIAREPIKQHDRLFSLETKAIELKMKATDLEERLGNRNRIEKKLWLKIEALEKRLNKLEKERSDLKETYRIIKRALG